MTGLCEVLSIRLQLGNRRWEYAERHAAAIARHWQGQVAANPSLFNGAILLLRSWQLAGGDFSGEYFETDFASYLYWRDARRRGASDADTSVRNCSGAALLLGADGGLLFGRAAAHTANAGHVYPLSGFVDRHDVDADGRVDPDGNVSRELAEEAGLAVADFERQPGYLLAFTDLLIQFAIVFRSRLSSTDLRRQMLDTIANQAAAELADVVIIRSANDLAAVASYEHCSLFADHLLATG